MDANYYLNIRINLIRRKDSLPKVVRPVMHSLICYDPIAEVSTRSLYFITPIRYASLFFVVGISADDNELITLEIIHRYVEVLDRYFGNVSFNRTRVFFYHWLLIIQACSIIRCAS